MYRLALPIMFVVLTALARRSLASPGQKLFSSSTAKMTSKKAILSVEAQRPMHWQTLDPFLFCAHHIDNYPASAGKGDKFEDMGVESKLKRGRDIGSDFGGLNGFNMYHGEIVPGFPSHPHYGFETITVAEKGLVDHFDSHGATARYGNGDVQWLTAGAGIQHGEMFPLVNSDKPNPAEIFQIWLNLPKAKKKSKPYFSMAWNVDQPRESFGEPGKQAHVRVVGGNVFGMKGVPSPPDSYASDARSEIVLATIVLDPDATLKLPAANASDINRAVFFYEGAAITVEGREIKQNVSRVVLAANQEVEIKNTGGNEVKLLFMQGRPLNEPVVQQGPFVTSSREELAEVYNSFRSTQFGGWRWGRSDMVHPRSEGRFLMIDGKRTDAPSEREHEHKEEKESDNAVGDACAVKKSVKYSSIEVGSEAKTQ